MVTKQSHIRHDSALSTGDVADRAFGVTTSTGYAPNVPVYFRRGTGDLSQATESHLSEDEDILNYNRSKRIRSFEKISLNDDPLNQFEHAVSGLRKIIWDYEGPEDNGKYLIQSPGFVQLNDQLLRLLNNGSFPLNSLESCRRIYHHLIQTAQQKDEFFISKKGILFKETKKSRFKKDKVPEDPVSMEN